MASTLSDRSSWTKKAEDSQEDREAVVVPDAAQLGGSHLLKEMLPYALSVVIYQFSSYHLTRC